MIAPISRGGAFLPSILRHAKARHKSIAERERRPFGTPHATLRPSGFVVTRAFGSCSRRSTVAGSTKSRSGSGSLPEARSDIVLSSASPRWPRRSTASASIGTTSHAARSTGLTPAVCSMCKTQMHHDFWDAALAITVHGSRDSSPRLPDRGRRRSWHSFWHTLSQQAPILWCLEAERTPKIPWHGFCTTRGMTNRFWGMLAGGLVLGAAACGGRAEAISGGSAGSSGHGGLSGGTGGNAGTGISVAIAGYPSAGSGSTGGGGLGSGGSDGCMGSLDMASQTLGTTCPSNLCPALASATAACDSPLGASSTTEQACGSLHAVTTDTSAGNIKTCVYSSDVLIGDAKLVGAFASGAGFNFCNGTSSTISAGQLLADCVAGPIEVLCSQALLDAESGAGGATDSQTPAATCFNGETCTPCCPTTPPDCMGKPDGYPGYSCSEGDGDDGSLCVCACATGKWQCAC